MLNLSIRMMKSQDEAEDAVQEAFIDAFKNMAKFKGKSTFGAWLKRIVINKCVYHMNVKKRLKWDQLNGMDVEAPPPDAQLELSPEVLNKAIAELPAGSRVVFTMKSIEGYQHAEIAKMLNISLSTSKSQYVRAKELLRVSLSKKVTI